MQGFVHIFLSDFKRLTVLHQFYLYLTVFHSSCQTLSREKEPDLSDLHRYTTENRTAKFWNLAIFITNFCKAVYHSPTIAIGLVHNNQLTCHSCMALECLCCWEDHRLVVMQLLLIFNDTAHVHISLVLAVAMPELSKQLHAVNFILMILRQYYLNYICML